MEDKWSKKGQIICGLVVSLVLTFPIWSYVIMKWILYSLGVIK